ncbi:Uncharacterised protein [Mycobacterium tuberculosis]|nr:Uncharacterised protein [Mycobacterium tuberculosis]
MREHSHTVAAHLGCRPVGVAVIHVPVGHADTLGQAVQHSYRLGGSGGRNPQHPVGAQPLPPVAQCRHPGSGEHQLGVDVRQQHEVVLGTVALREDHLRHSSITRSGYVPP